MPDAGPPALTVALGGEDLLIGRAVADVVAAARANDSQAEVRELTPEALAAESLADLLSPGMFGDRVVVLRDAQDLPEAVRTQLVRYADAPAAGISLVVCHPGGAKGKKLVDGLTSAGAHVVRCAKLTRPSERIDFVRAELKRGGRSCTPAAARVLIDAVGSDLRELAAACAQLVADTAGPVDEELVGRYHRGRAETTGFQVADAAVAGDRPLAVSLTRQALQSGTPELLVTSALAAALRDAARARACPSAAVAARELGMPPWKAERAYRTGRSWTDAALAAALAAVARADRDVKGEAVDRAYAVERAVLAVVVARQQAAGRARSRSGQGGRRSPARA